MQRLEDEAASLQVAVRQFKPLGRMAPVAEQEQVDVDRARTVPDASRAAAELTLDRLACVEQLLRGEIRLDLDDRVEEVGLVEHLPLRCGLVHGRRALHLHPV